LNRGKKLKANQKRGQLTIFIVVGLIVLVGGILFFYLTQKAVTTLEPEIKIVEEQVPNEFDPIKSYANQCAYSVGVEGLKLIGEQGGYISFTDKALNQEPFTITRTPTESDAVAFTKNSELIIPYWWHLKSANNCRGDCKFASKRPELRQAANSIEKQLERFIAQRFKECLDDFMPFVEKGFKISELGNVNADVVIGLDDVTVLVEYPFNAERQDVKARISQFPVKIPINLNKVYELGTKITNLEIKHRYLEKHVLNLLVAFSGVDREKLPPMSDMQFKFGSTTSWQKSDIKNKITGLLSYYVPLFQVDGTFNYDRLIFDSELKQRLYDSTIVPVANDSFRDLSAYFTYLDFWPVYFDLNCKGERCAPSSANSLISFFGIQDYRFAYDLSFPVLVEIKDPFALNGQGYTFSFFLEGNIRNNKAMPADFAPLEKAALSERSLFCDIRTSGNVSINVVNAATKKPVNDAQILYTIIDESCFIGSTNSDGMLKEVFPIGIGGVINVVRDAYIGKAVEFDPKVSKDDSLKINLYPTYTKKLIVRKKNVAKTPQGWQFINTPLDLSDKESAVITLTRINGEGELDFSSVANYEGKQKEPSEIEIAPGKYTADATLILNERVVIPPKEKCVGKKFLGIGKKECFTIPKVDFGEGATEGEERFAEGGLKLNITIKPGDLERYDTLVFYVISADIVSIPEQDRVIEDIEQIGKIEDYSNTYRIALQPTFE